MTSTARETALDTSRATIPEGKFAYLLESRSKAGIFRDSMGFDRNGLGAALRQHLLDNSENTWSITNPFGGTKVAVTGLMTGPSGSTWKITSVWNIESDGAIRFITATPAR
ncbi:MAG: hypothetical protein ACR2PL_17045 [Dehalococcoidia bacterium]